MTDKKMIILKAVVIATSTIIVTIAFVILLIYMQLITPSSFEVDMGSIRVISSRQAAQCPGNPNFNCTEAYVLSVIMMVNPNQGREIAALNIPLQQ
jgi:hypothetical protein